MIRVNRVTLMLAQYAQAADGMLNVIGAGWTQMGPQPGPFAIAGIVELPWDAAGVQHKMRLDLLDDQGKAVLVQTPEGEKPLLVEGVFDVAPMPGTKRGTPLVMPIAINLPPQAIPAGRYEWRLELDGETHEDWRLGFNVLPEVQSQAA